MRLISLLAVSAAIALPMRAGELPTATLARFLKVIATVTKEGKVAVGDALVKKELAKLGVEVDPAAKVLWTNSEQEAIQQAKAQRFVVCPQADWISKGASIALTEEGGRPVVYISPTNAQNCNIRLPDTILKAGKIVK